MQPLLKCRIFEVVRSIVRGSDGRDRPYEYAIHPGAVVVLPLLEGGRQVVLIRNYRHAIERELWELPAGLLDRPDEEHSLAARRELEEETGYQAGAIRELGRFYTSPGVLTELIRAYVASDLKKTKQRLGPTEKITVEIVEFDEAIRMIRDGRIEDAKTIVALLMWNLEQRNPT